jgi:hypothetical protein
MSDGNGRWFTQSFCDFNIFSTMTNVSGACLTAIIPVLDLYGAPNSYIEAIHSSE